VEELDSQLPLDAQKLTKSFSQVFSDHGELYHHQPSRASLDMGHFKDMMVKEGLRFADENQDILGLSHLAQTHHLTWFDLYRLAKQTAVNHQISLKRLTAQLEQKEQPTSTTDGWSDQERATLKAVKSHDAVAFLQLMKQSRQAMVLDTERKMLKDLAELGFLDEVINVLVLRALTTGKTANLNKVYVMKLANDFSYQKIRSAEEALTYLKQIKSGSSAMSQKKTKQGTGQTKTNVPAWSDQDYKNQTSQEGQERLAAYKRRRLEELGKGD
jgi:replication initiation and membrane attachment protein